MSNILGLLYGTSNKVLPFDDPLVAAKLFLAAGTLAIIYLIVRAVIFSRSLTLHRAPAVVACAYVAASLVNIMICVIFHWFAALPMCILITVIFMFTTAGDVKEANSEERSGVWGLNRDIRRIRGELFNDMTPAEQVEYRNNVKEYHFNRWLFAAVTLIVPAVFVLICYVSGTGYDFTSAFM